MSSETTVQIGYVTEIYRFVDEFSPQRVTNALSSSASMGERCGGVRKPAIFEHPLPQGEASVEYDLSLQDIPEDKVVALIFDVGLRDGIKFDDPQAPFNGVKFALEINDKRVFEKEVYECKWESNLIDLTEFAGKKVKVRFITDCNGEGNTNYDWALWGDPRIISITPSTQIKRFTNGLLLYEMEMGELGYLEFSFPESRPAEHIARQLVPQIENERKGHIAQLCICSYMPEPALFGLNLSKAVVNPGEHFEVRCFVENRGKAPIEPDHRLLISLESLELRRDSRNRPIDRLDPGESLLLRWQVRGNPKETAVNIEVSLSAIIGGERISQRVARRIELEKPVTKPPTRPPVELKTYNQTGCLVLENRNLRALFVADEEGFKYIEIYASGGEAFYHVANLKPISCLIYKTQKGETRELNFVPESFSIGGDLSSGSITLSSKIMDEEGILWRFKATFSLNERGRWLDVDYSLSVDSPRSLLRFSGPTLYVGDGSFGSRKSFALFPGLEFLEDGEVSSSTRDADPPINLRLTPHPLKVTIPLIAIEDNGYLVGVMWNQLQRWDGQNSTLSATFASPNWYENQDNHLISLFLPAVPDWVEENERVAREPYHISPERPIRFSCKILAEGGAGILDAVDRWIEAYGLPNPQPQPRSDEEELLLCRHALMETVWDGETGKSRHCVGWKPANTPGFATLLWLDYLASRDEEVRERVELIARSTIRDEGPGGLASTANCHILRWEFPFYWGYLREGIQAAREQVYSLIQEQEPDGSWRFHPRDDKTRELGREGDAVLGICASKALAVLKFARITGDEKAVESGLKALRFMDTFKVPRGAQSWECPIYEPDILAAAYAVGAYVEGYRITGDEGMLRKAEYWARTGLPFLYFWSLPDRPGMLFASIPVFGTTFYTHSWFGVPVQWNGLVYAYYLQQLAKFSPSPIWKKVAEGITVSAMYQQWTEGELKGTYPDGFYGFCTEGRGPHINPENILVNLFTLRGVDPDVSTEIIRRKGRRIHINSPAEIEEVRFEDGLLKVKLNFVEDAPDHLAVFNVDEPAMILADGTFVPEVSRIEGVKQGWIYDREEKALYVRLYHRKPTIEIELKWFESSGEKNVGPIPSKGFISVLTGSMLRRSYKVLRDIGFRKFERHKASALLSHSHRRPKDKGEREKWERRSRLRLITRRSPSAVDRKCVKEGTRN
ncbi:hypothetical protein J7M22_02155 [Candidatus Poribacteria bacterium]|nr:hypothetical protein [Candidatus Poribacteria bacterium]